LVFRSRNALVFVHGCYWHKHACKRGQSTPKTHAAFWRKKRTSNRARDHRIVTSLRRAGWRVLVVWECQTRHPVSLAEKLALFLGAC
jgi:DNA mismatch endonuclease (patch repair protein)